MQKITKTPFNKTNELTEEQLQIGQVYLVTFAPSTSIVTIGEVVVKGMGQVIFLEEKVWGSGVGYKFRALLPGEKVTIENTNE